MHITGVFPVQALIFNLKFLLGPMDANGKVHERVWKETSFLLVERIPSFLSFKKKKGGLKNKPYRFSNLNIPLLQLGRCKTVREQSAKAGGKAFAVCQVRKVLGKCPWTYTNRTCRWCTALWSTSLYPANILILYNLWIY